MAEVLAARLEREETVGAMPSYATVRRFMQSQGLLRQPRVKSRRPGEPDAPARLPQREAAIVGGYHVDGSIKEDIIDASNAGANSWTEGQGVCE